MTDAGELTTRGRLQTYLQALPGACQAAAQFAVDNPGSCAVLLSGVFLAPRVAVRIYRPRNLGEAIALAVLLEFGLSWAAAKLIESGTLPIRLRDHHGCLHVINEADPGSA